MLTVSPSTHPPTIFYPGTLTRVPARVEFSQPRMLQNEAFFTHKKDQKNARIMPRNISAVI